MTRIGIPRILRILSGAAGVIVFIIGLLVSLGAILASPLGMWFVQRRTRRLNRRPSRIASLVGAASASSLLAALVWSVIFARLPRPTSEELQSAAQQSQTRPSIKLPDWYANAFPQSVVADSVSQRMIRSPGFVRITFILGAISLALLFGVLGGITGWAAFSLLGLGWYGERAAGQSPSRPAVEAG